MKHVLSIRMQIEVVIYTIVIQCMATRHEPRRS